MSHYVFKYQKLFMFMLNVLCKVLGIAIICLYVREKKIILLLIGAFTFFIPSFGCAGSYFESGILLIVYGILQVLFVFVQVFLFTYYICGQVSGTSTNLDMQFYKISTAEWITLCTAGFLDLLGGIFSLYLARKIKWIVNDYDNFQNEDNDNCSDFQNEIENGL